MQFDKHYDRFEMNGIYELVKTFSYTQQEFIRSVNLDGLQQVAKIMAESSAKYSMFNISHTLQDVAKQLTSKLEQSEHSIPQAALYQIAYTQVSTFALIEKTLMTSMLEGIKNSLLTFNYGACLELASKELENPLIEAANVSFFKRSDIIQMMSSDLTYPKGFLSAMKALNVAAAARLAKCDDISYEASTRKFIVEANPESKATSTEVNVICSGADILEVLSTDNDDTITEAELMEFLNFLKETPTFGSDNAVGRKILDLIQSVAHCMDFDCNIYYHARHRDVGSCPYTFSDMLTAPNGVPGPGRYNHPGQAYYYFANTREGVEAEIRKHVREGIIQTAIIKPNRSIRILDLSSTIRGGATFLRFVRFPVSDMLSRMPREYLIPCYVSDCCRSSGMDGIKYYGGADYSNYVSWNSGHFDFVRMEA